MKFSLLILTLAVSAATVLGVDNDILANLDDNMKAVAESIIESANVGKAKQQTTDPCDHGDCRCLTGFNVFAQTSDISLSTSGGPHEIELIFDEGKNQTFQLTGLPGSKQTKLFKFTIDITTDCHSIFDLTGIIVRAVSTDGWNIETIVTTFADGKGSTYCGSIDNEVNRWIDHQDLPEYESFSLSLTSHC